MADEGEAKAADPRDESEAERADRNLGELLQELRVAGLGVLAGAARLAAAHGASLRVVCARRRVRQLFGLTQLDQAVPVVASLAEIQVAPGADAEAV